MKPVVIFPDVQGWATTWLTAALAARGEAYAQGVTVAPFIPAGGSWRMPWVWVRRDGGARQDLALEKPRLSVNVFHATDEDAVALANLVRALLWSAPDGDPVTSAVELSGPSPIPDTHPRYFFTFELTVRGAQA